MWFSEVFKVQRSEQNSTKNVLPQLFIKGGGCPSGIVRLFYRGIWKNSVKGHFSFDTLGLNFNLVPQSA